MKRNSVALTGQVFDLLVCGGGIYGAWTAYDAARRGLSVALIDQGDWASATSSASSKLIHGGLRYLETGDFHLVKKALAERQRLWNMAPHRVWPLRFMVPLYKHGRLCGWQLKAGLTLYDFLAPALETTMKHRYHSMSDVLQQHPTLKIPGLYNGYSYIDAQTDDARLVLELVAGAMAAGAVCVNYCQLQQVIEKNGLVASALLFDQVEQQELRIEYKQLVYTSGQWIKTQQPEWCRLSKGVHLILPALSMEQALLLTAPQDGRVFFVIPWYGRTIVGTTDRDFSGDVNQVAVEADDIAYLLTACLAYLNTNWSAADVLGSYAGLRVFQRSGKHMPSAVSRDWALQIAENGALYSIGGKITSAREDVCHIVDRVCAELGKQVMCETAQHPLPWSPNEPFASWLARKQQKAAQLGIDAEALIWLLRRHGTQVTQILTLIQQNPALAQRIVPDVPLIYADLQLCASQEMVVHLGDLLRRRMPLLILARLQAADLLAIAQQVAPILGWNEARVAQEMALLR